MSITLRLQCHPSTHRHIYSSTHPPTHPSIHPASVHLSTIARFTHPLPVHPLPAYPLISLYIYTHSLVPTHPGNHTTTFIVTAHSHSTRYTSVHMGHFPLVAGSCAWKNRKGLPECQDRCWERRAPLAFAALPPAWQPPSSAAGAQMSGRLPLSSQPQQLGEECASFVWRLQGEQA